ncbi:MAG: tetratricopeptide repeat protein [Ignavibacteria bacterium]|jgi:tetratricopeptide (TPR) repeat protein|nr:tetratricopeptide repeat protein [Ignavibacteria bacterium]MCU7503540.1 tetratricopeptide repeat protein [Ignavibacteria bacterium]MCU7516806.1 tetratricopeptide repeat protein [Ignavibacteria bacterium]
MKAKFTSVMLILSVILSLVLVLQATYPQKKQQKTLKGKMTTSKDEIPITTQSQEARQKYIEGIILLSNLRTDKAKASFQDAIKADPNFALGYLGLAQTAGIYTEQKKNIEKAESLSGNVSEGEKNLILLIKSQFEGDVAKAKEAVDKLISMFPKDKWAEFYAGGYEFAASRNYDAVIGYMQKAIDIDHGFAPAYNLMGYAYSYKNDFNKAESSFKKYISLVPDNPNPYDSYAELLLKNGRYDESIKQYQKALNIDPNFWSSYEGLGNNYLFKNNFSKARENYQQLYDKSSLPNWKLVSLYDQAVSYVREGDIDNALTVLDKQASLAESEGAAVVLVNSHNNQGFILAENGKPEEAMKHFDMAKEKIESSGLPDQQKKNLTASVNLLRAYGLIAQGKMDDAKSELDNKDKLIGSSTDPGIEKDYESVQGYLALKENKYDEALTHFQKADDQSPIVWYYMSMAYDKKGDSGNAAKLVEKIKKSNQNSMDLAIAHNNSKATVAKETK